jgi:hypothetical protein
MAFRQSATAVALVALCVGCAVQRSNHAERAQAAMVGLSKADLYRCAGLPDKQERVGEEEFLTYQNDLLTSGGITLPIIGGGVNFFDSKYCHATFVLKGSKITDLSYAGNTASTLAPLDQCGYIIDACIDRLDKAREGKP